MSQVEARDLFFFLALLCLFDDTSHSDVLQIAHHIFYLLGSVRNDDANIHLLAIVSRSALSSLYPLRFLPLSTTNTTRHLLLDIMVRHYIMGPLLRPDQAVHSVPVLAGLRGHPLGAAAVQLPHGLPRAVRPLLVPGRHPHVHPRQPRLGAHGQPGRLVRRPEGLLLPHVVG